MPTDPAVWIVLIVVGGGVLALALWLGRGLKLKSNGVDLQVDANKPVGAPGVSAFNGGRVGDQGRVGNITGVKVHLGQGDGHDDGQVDLPRQEVAVANRAQIEGTVGDITGVAITNQTPEGH